MEWMILPLKRYAEFSGRSRRMEYWMFFLFGIIVSVIATIIDGVIFGFESEMTPLSWIASLALFIPQIAVAVRRLHDIGKSGWWYLLIFAIIIGWIVLLIWFCTEGDNGTNEYGPDPKGGVGNVDSVFD